MLGALVTRTLWTAGTPVLLAMAAGAAVATASALVIGAAAFRLRGAYFAIGTLALGEISRTTVAGGRAVRARRRAGSDREPLRRESRRGPC